MQYIMFLFNAIQMNILNEKQYIMSSKYIILSSQESVEIFFFFSLVLIVDLFYALCYSQGIYSR